MLFQENIDSKSEDKVLRFADRAGGISFIHKLKFHP